jgi:hypothetical protein
MINCHGCISVFTKKKLKYLDAYYEKNYKNMPSVVKNGLET